MKTLNKWIDKIDNFFAYIAAATLLLMAILVFLDVFFRFTFNNPIQGTIEITGEYLMVIIVYFGISYTLKEDGHVSVDFFKGYIPKKFNKALKIISGLLAIIVLVIMSYSNLLKGLEYFQKNVESSSLLSYPLAPALFIISLGLLLVAVRLLVNLINIIIQLNHRDAIRM